MTVSDVTTSGGTLIINNPQDATMTLNFNVKVVAIGPQ